MLALLILWSCSSGEPRLDLAESASAAFADCDPRRIDALTERQNLRLALKPCGGNTGAVGQWSADGRSLVLSLQGAALLLDGAERTLGMLPGEAPTAPPAWIRPGVVALPLAPLEGESGSRLAIYDLAQQSMDVLAFPQSEPRDLSPDGEHALWLTARGADGLRRPWRLEAGARALSPALPWLTGPVDRLDVAGTLVGWSDADGAHVALRADGSGRSDLAGFTRALPHPDGRYVLLEGPGPPVPTFDQAPWGETTPEQRARQAERTSAFVKRLPEHVPETLTPPELQVLDRSDGSRWRVRGFQGDHAQWYPGGRGWLSFTLWGVEDKQVNPNIALVDLLTRVQLAGAGAPDAGLIRVNAEASR